MKIIQRIGLSAATLVSSLLLYVPQAFANTTTGLFMTTKAIELNGQTVSKPMGFVYGGTTFMPIYYVMQALKQFGTQNTWTGHVWNISTPAPEQISTPIGGSGADTICANGKGIFHVNGIVTEDPASHINTTYMPVWYVMQVLKNVGIQNNWDGTNWTIAKAGLQVSSASGLSSTNTTTPNLAANDELFWGRASKDLYVTVSTDSNFSSSGTKPLLNFEPNQTSYLLMYSDTSDINEPVQWFVNSPNATVTSDTIHDWTIGTHHAMAASFVATKPGIYTVQGEVNGKYSVPYVFIVGMDQLSGPRVNVPATSSGVAALPANLPSVKSEQGDNLTYVPYQPINGWLPISGTVSNSASTVVVDIENTSGTQEWNYVLPVENNRFGEMVRIPMQGDIQVSLIPDMWNMLNQMNGSWLPGAYYHVYSSAPPLAEGNKALLSSAMMDWNMDSSFSKVASILVDNSPSKDTAIAAISNYVSELVVYDYADYNANQFVWKNSTMTWKNPVGVCEDIAELASSMLKSVEIPAETLTGTAPPNAQKDDHEWMRAFDGTKWIVVDPTWNSANGNINSSLSNEYMTSTDSLVTSHVLDTSQSYTWQ